MLFLLLSISAVSADTVDDDLSLGDNQTLVETGSNQNIDEATGVSSGQVDQDTLAESSDDSLDRTNDESLRKRDENFGKLQTLINDADSYVELSEDYVRTETDMNLEWHKAGNFTIEGNNHKIDANGLGPIFTGTLPHHLILKNLVLMNAKDNAININAVTIINCTFFNNSATENGGAISTQLCSLTAVNSTFISNRAGSGGGAIYAFGGSKVLIDGCKFISNAANDGGALYFSVCPVTLTNSTFTQNTAQSKGKAIFNKGNITLSNSSFSENGDLGEYAIYNDLYLSLNNNTVSNLIFNNREINTLVSIEPDNEVHKISSSSFTVNAFLKDDNGNNIHDESFTFTVNGLSKYPAFNATSGMYTLNYDLGGYGVAYVRIVNSMYNIDIPYGTYDYNYLGSFRDLQEKVNSAGDVLNLDYDFKFTDADRDLLSSDGVRINRNIIINANNHTINADEKSRHFLIGSSYTVTLQNMKLNNGRSNEGGSIHCEGNLVLINCTFNDNNRGWDSKGDVIFSTGDLSSYNCYFSSKRELLADGGALYLAGNYKTIILENTKFINFVSSISSGGVIFNGWNTLQISNCLFKGCSALSYGGAIYSWGDVRIKGTVFDNCGNVIYNGGTIYANGVFEIENSSFRHNTNNNNIDNGGAIYALNNVYVRNTNFSTYRVKESGGAIYVKNADELLVINSIFNGNQVDDTAKGGAIYAENVNNVVIRESTFEGNRNTYYEGDDGYAIYHTGVQLTVRDSKFINNGNHNSYAIYNEAKLLVDNTTVTNGIYNKGSVRNKLTATVLNNQTYEVPTGRLKLNVTLADDWGNRYNVDGLTFTGIGFSQDIVYDTGLMAYEGSYLFTHFGDYTIGAQSSSIENLDVKTGVYRVYFDKTFTHLADLIYRESTTSLDLNHDFAYSPDIDGNEYKEGIAITKSFTINGHGHVIDGVHLAKMFYVDHSVIGFDIVTLTLNDIIFVNGFDNGDGTHSKLGGAINNAAKLVLNNCTFINNMAANNGGAVYSTGELIINNSKFIKNGHYYVDLTNYNTVCGGAIHFIGSMKAYNTLFDSNTAFWEAGAIAADGDLELYNATFTNNEILYYEPSSYKPEYHVGHGGAIYGIKTGATYKIVGSLFNDSSVRGLGTIFAESGSKLEVIDTTFYETGAFEGGCIYTNLDTFIENSNFEKCWGDNGGAICAKDKLVIYNSNFIDNGARFATRNGGAIYCEKAIEVYNSNFTHNYAVGGAGAIVSKSLTDSFIISNCTFKDNINNNHSPYQDPDLRGGAVRSYGPLFINDSKFLNNLAGHGGGAICCLNVTSIINSKFELNHAGNGQAIFIGDNALANIINSTFTNHSVYSIYNNGRLNLSNNNISDIINNRASILSELALTTLNGTTIRYAVNENHVLFATLNDDNGNDIFADGVKLIVGEETFNATYNATTRLYEVSNHFDCGLYTVGASYETDKLLVYEGMVDIEYLGTFTDLNDRIISADRTLDLDCDFSYDSNVDSRFRQGIIISKPIVINGNGYTINASSMSGFMQITKDNVVLNNITFVNATAPHGIFINNANDCTIANCNFSNNSNVFATVFSNGLNCEIVNCIFNNNKGTFISFQKDGGKILNSTFTGNTVVAVKLQGSNLVKNCNFTDNAGGAIEAKGSFTIDGSTFTQNSAENGGAIYADGIGRINNSKFYGNTATNNGNAIYVNGNLLNITNSKFEDNGADDEFAIYNRGNLTLENNSISNIIYNMKVGNGGHINSEIISNMITTNVTEANLTQKVHITANLVDDNGNAVYDPNFYIMDNGENIGMASYDPSTKLYSLDYTLLYAGRHLLNVMYDNKAISLLAPLISVQKQNLTFKLDIENGYIYKNLKGSIVLEGLDFVNATGTIDLYINGKAYSFDINGSFNKKLDLPSIDVDGDYAAFAIYSGDGNYNRAVDDVIFKIQNYDLYMSVDAPSIVYGENATVAIDIIDDATGTVNITVNNKTYTLRLIESRIAVIDVLDAGNYTVSAKYLGDEKYGEFIANATLTVRKAQSTIELPNKEITAGEKATYVFDLPDDYTGTISMELEGVEATINDRTVILDTSRLSSGGYLVSVKYSNDRNYEDSEDTALLTIKKISPSISVNVTDIEFKQTEEIKIKMFDDISDNLIVYVNDRGYVVKMSNGIAELTLPGLNVGKYVVNVTYMGDDNHARAANTTSFEVKEASNFTVNITIPPILPGEDFKINVTLPEDAKGTVEIYVDGKIVESLPIEKGVVNASVPLDIKSGDHNVEVKINTDNYGNVTRSENLHIKAILIKADDMARGYNSGMDFTAALIDEDGNAIYNENVTFTINGKNYVVLTDAQGVASINPKLNAGSYKVTLSSPKAGENVTKNLQIVKRIEGNNNVKIYYGNNYQYKLRIFGDDGNAVKAGVKVTVTVNGKAKTLNTDKNGYIVFKFSKNYKPKTYNVAASYKGFKVSNKVVVKNVLKLKNAKVKMSAKKLVLKATLKQGKKALKGKNVIFKFKGKKFKVKTNKKGVAKVTIKKNILKKLKVGKKVKYSATYLKSTVKRTAKVKR